MMKVIRYRLTTYEVDFPELKGCKPEIVGFGWHQGWNDGCSTEMTAEYEENMANFINDVRMGTGRRASAFRDREHRPKRS